MVRLTAGFYCRKGIMDPLHFCISIVPVAMYLLLIGWLNVSKQPLLTTGARDVAALAIAVSGFIIAGPMELFLPEAFAAVLGAWVWLPLLLLYALVVTLIILLMRPSFIVYNMSREQLRPLVQEEVHSIDPSAEWAGDSVVVPLLGIQLALESYPGMRNVMIVSVGPEQNLDGWQTLGQRLQLRIGETTQTSNPQGVSLILLGIMLLVATAYQLLSGKQEIAQAVREMLRM